MAAVTEQPTEAFDWKLIGFLQRGRIHWNFSHSKSVVWQKIEPKYVYIRSEILSSTYLSVKYAQMNISIKKFHKHDKVDVVYSAR